MTPLNILNSIEQKKCSAMWPPNERAIYGIEVPFRAPATVAGGASEDDIDELQRTPVVQWSFARACQTGAHHSAWTCMPTQKRGDIHLLARLV